MVGSDCECKYDIVVLHIQLQPNTLFVLSYFCCCGALGVTGRGNTFALVGFSTRCMLVQAFT
eukprot:2054630-Amphidinium_carterae.1